MNPLTESGPQWLVYCTDPSFGFIEPDGSRCYILQGPRPPKDVRKLGYRFTSKVNEAWPFPSEAQARNKARIVNEHIGWTAAGESHMAVKPAK